jgi:hypothetical protein
MHVDIQHNAFFCVYFMCWEEELYKYIDKFILDL